LLEHSARRGARGLLVVAAFVVLGALLAYPRTDVRTSPGPRRRLLDEARIIPPADVPRFEQYLAWIFAESDVDIRFVFVRGLGGRSLEEVAVRKVDELGIGGRTQGERGLLLLYDFESRRARIEVGYGLEEYFPDGFVGYLMHEHAESFFAAGDLTMGLKFLLRILQDRVREAILGDRFDPRVLDVIRRGTHLSGGAGSSAALPISARAEATSAEPPNHEEQARYVPQETPEAAYLRYIDWLAAGRFVPNVSLFTSESRDYLAELPMSPAYFEYILLKEYGRAYRIYEKNDLALLYFTSDPLVCPHFFRRGPRGWEIDIVSEVHNTTNRTGGIYAWDYRGQNDVYTRAFGDKLINIRGYVRLQDGDNRMLPVRATAD
jgi:uncharacterized protein